MVLLVLSCGRVHGDSPEGPEPLASRVRRPVALAFSPDGNWLFVANARSGSLSVIDPRAARVVAEHDLGHGLADVIPLSGDRHLLAVDREADALLLLETRDDSVRVVERLGVGPDPVAVVVAPDGGACVVASTRSRRLTFVGIAIPDREGPSRLTVLRSLDLPFSPRNMVLADAGARLVVADAFGGKLAVVDRRRGMLESVRTLPAHNIRGLAVTPDGRTLVVAHQTLHARARTDFEDVHWGRLLSSHLRSLRIDAVLTPGTDDELLRGGCVIDLGSANDGAGDPAGLACDRSGVVVVALGGVDQIALGRSPSGYFRRYGVGRRPTALALAPEGKTVFVADTLDDTISIVEVATGRRLGAIDLGPRPEPTLVERGERLFHDARLSHDGWMSCQSCHTDGQSNGQLADTLGDGSYGAPKLIPSLLGTGTTGPWSWNGSIDRLEDQVRKSVRMTMRGSSPSDDQVAALTGYLRSLSAATRSIPAEETAAVARGRAVFRSQGCATCHAPPSYTMTGRYDVGLADEAGNRKFNPPSLRGVGRRGPFLHDGRAATLDAVFLEHRHPRDAEMTPEEVTDLAAFLRSL
jgi:DNA-binding beta-propeller fold protein YncE